MRAVSAVSAPVSISVEDAAPYHVHPPGQPFVIAVKAETAATSNARIEYHWQSFSGNRLSPTLALENGQYQNIKAPGSAPGYYGLILSSTDPDATFPNRQPGEKLEFGFLIRSKPEPSKPDASARFGVVHGDQADPYMPVWLKSLEWETTSHQWLNFELRRRYSHGKLELPMIGDERWNSDDNRAITIAELENLKQHAKQYFSFSPFQVYWETGVEENLQPKYNAPYYWNNLTAKIRTLRNAANETNPGIKFVYQVANLTPLPIDKFLNSEAAKYYDVLALHPYAWPDFKSPETWLEDFLTGVRQMADASGWHNPIWFTEVGAPHYGNAPGAFFGYPQSATPTGGLSRSGTATYLVKLLTMAAHLNVEKLFWYNYRDAGLERDFAESHFGLRDYWGYPKPAYAAFVNIVDLLEWKLPVNHHSLPGHVHVYEFRGAEVDVLVAWAQPRTPVHIPLDALRAGLTRADVIKVTDVVGTPLAEAVSADGLILHAQPYFVVVKANH